MVLQYHYNNIPMGEVYHTMRRLTVNLSDNDVKRIQYQLKLSDGLETMTTIVRRLIRTLPMPVDKKGMNDFEAFKAGL